MDQKLIRSAVDIGDGGFRNIVLDSGYRGEIHAIVTNCSDSKYLVEPGQRIGQLVVMPIIIADFITDDIKERGSGAFGSTGE